jgi:hypothetical protein
MAKICMDDFLRRLKAVGQFIGPFRQFLADPKNFAMLTRLGPMVREGYQLPDFMGSEAPAAATPAAKMIVEVGPAVPLSATESEQQPLPPDRKNGANGAQDRGPEWIRQERERLAGLTARLERFDSRSAIEKEYGIVSASAIEEKPTSWLPGWEGFFPLGEFSIIEGDPDVGKTLLLLTIIAVVTKAGYHVIYLTAEDSLAKTIIPRLKAAGANLDRVHVQRVDARLLLLPDAVDDLSKLIEETGAKLLVLDPFNAYLDASKVHVNREQEVRQALRPLRDLAEEKDIVIIGLRHLTKDTDRPSLYRGGGSIGLAAVARSVVLVAKHPEDPELRVITSQKCNLCSDEKKVPRAFHIGQDEAGRPRLEWEDDAPLASDGSPVTPDYLLDRKKPGPEPVQIDKAEQYIADHLANGPKPREDVIEAAKHLPISGATMDRAARRMKREGRLVSEPVPNSQQRMWKLTPH